MIALRQATLDDLALIDDIHCRSRRATYRGLVSDHYLDVTMPAASRASWEDKLPQVLAGGGCALVAENGGEAIGFACAQPVDGDGVVYLNNLHALPERKGRGVGTALLAEVARHARSRGARAMRLHVLASNAPAIGFYESRGWRHTGDDTLEWAGQTVATRLYELALT